MSPKKTPSAARASALTVCDRGSVRVRSARCEFRTWVIVNRAERSAATDRRLSRFRQDFRLPPASTTSESESLWLATAPSTSYPPLARDIAVDVAVLGGGIAGLTTALLLKRDGARVAVIEAGRVGRGVT